MQKKESRLLAVLTAVLTAMATLTGSIAVPLLCRSFYYAHIWPMRLTETAGMTDEQIRVTFDEVMDYCLGRVDTFSLTFLPWSDAGASHFADVKMLFVLDLRLAAISLLLLAILWLVCRFSGIVPYRFRGHSPGFWAAAGLGVLFLAVGGFAALDFDRFFVVFHMIFFPGKDNWIFSYQTDPVIYLLPQEFFRNCGLLVFGLVVTCCIVLILADRRARKRRVG